MYLGLTRLKDNTLSMFLFLEKENWSLSSWLFLIFLSVIVVKLLQWTQDLSAGYLNGFCPVGQHSLNFKFNFIFLSGIELYIVCSD